MSSINLFLELIKVSIGVKNKLSRSLTSEDLEVLYLMAEKQSILGVCYVGIERLVKQQQVPLTDLVIDWYGQAERIKTRNGQVNEQCSNLQSKLKHDGLKACILKGQGVAQSYDTNLRNLRQSGDIDVWIQGGYNVVCNYVQNTNPNLELAYHRFHYDCFENTEVELHQHPSLMNNPYHNWTLQKWFEKFKEETFIWLEELKFYTPSSEFNKVFLLCHLYRHFIAEGVGLRQLMDYYFVLKNSGQEEDELVIPIIKKLGMSRFTRAVMWIMKELFCIEPSKLFFEPNEKEGQYLLSEVLTGGNFGKFDQRYDHTGRFALQIQNIRHSAHLVLHYPSEVLWSPAWLIWHFFWKKIKVNRIKKNSAYLSK